MASNNGGNKGASKRKSTQNRTNGRHRATAQSFKSSENNSALLSARHSDTRPDTDTRTHRHSDTRTHGHTDTRTHGLPGCRYNSVTSASVAASAERITTLCGPSSGYPHSLLPKKRCFSTSPSPAFPPLPGQPLRAESVSPPCGHSVNPRGAFRPRTIVSVNPSASASLSPRPAQPLTHNALPVGLVSL